MSSSSSPPIETLHAVPAAPHGQPRPQPDFWYARGALSFIIFLQVLLQNTLKPSHGMMPPWMLTVVEILLLAALSFACSRDRHAHRRAGRLLDAKTGTSQSVRRLALFLISLITILNLASLLTLVRALLTAGKASGADLLDDAAILWTTNVICFALCYWELDRGGPSRRETPRQRQPDFLFANMTLPDGLSRPWTPRFVDYLFSAFTNASAFSPTDALPLTARAKLIMMVQASVSLLTIAIVAARAVNILA